VLRYSVSVLNERIFTAREKQLIQRVLSNGTMGLTVPERKSLATLRYRIQRLTPRLKDEISMGETLLEFLITKELFLSVAKNWRRFREARNVEELLLGYLEIKEEFRSLSSRERKKWLEKFVSRSIEESNLESDSIEAGREA